MYLTKNKKGFNLQIVEIQLYKYNYNNWKVKNFQNLHGQSIY